MMASPCVGPDVRHPSVSEAANGPSATLHWGILESRSVPLTPERSVQALGSPLRHRSLTVFFRQLTMLDPHEIGVMLVERHSET